jgi:hypothetical protein
LRLIVAKENKMAYEGTQRTIPGVVASGDLSSDQYKFVNISATGAAVNTTLGGVVDGVLQDAPDAINRAATVAFSGVTKVVAGAAVVKGARVMSNATGLAITAATTGSHIKGTALEAAGASGDIIAILLDTQGVV